MSVSNVTNLSDRREPNRHAIRGPHGQFIKADRLDKHEAETLAEMMRPVHHVPHRLNPDPVEAALLDAAIGSALPKLIMAAGIVVAALILWSLR